MAATCQKCGSTRISKEVIRGITRAVCRRCGPLPKKSKDVSSRAKRKKKAKFIMFDQYMIRTAAWQSLTPNEITAYLHLKWLYDGLNNGRIGLGERELAEVLKSGRDTARRSLLSLAEKGFVSKTRPSGFNVKNRTATEWRLTEYTCDVTGELPTKEFARWGLEEKSTGAPQVHTGALQGKSGLRMGAKHG